MSIQSSTFNHF